MVPARVRDYGLVTARLRTLSNLFQKHEGVAMDYFAGDLVAEQRRDLSRALARDLQHIRCRIIYQSAAEFYPVGIEQADALFVTRTPVCLTKC
jgi:hypothetical protein